MHVCGLTLSCCSLVLCVGGVFVCVSHMVSDHTHLHITTKLLPSHTLTHYHKAPPPPAFPEAPPTAPSASKQLMNKMESSVGEWLRLVFSHVHFPMFVVAFSKCYVVLNSTLWLHLELI